jgi:hypothetical protein
MIRTKSLASAAHPSAYMNIEMYSIAFTAQYFWVIFVVVWTSIIGLSQRAGALPRILTRFRKDLAHEFPTDRFPTLTQKLQEKELTPRYRIYRGGIYSWQPGRSWEWADHN